MTDILKAIKGLKKAVDVFDSVLFQDPTFGQAGQAPGSRQEGCTEHYLRVREFIEKVLLVEIPDTVKVPANPEILCKHASVMLEETLEAIDGMGVQVRVGGGIAGQLIRKDGQIKHERLAFDCVKEPDIAEVADGAADMSVTAMGLLALFGIKDKDLLAEVDAANLRKRPMLASSEIQIGMQGALKPEDWRGPDIENVLKSQGWQEK